MTPVLYIGNRNYSSWSLRPWLALRWGGIDFDVRVVPLGGPGYRQKQMAQVLAVSASGTVPALHLGPDVIGDSLAICEWAAEQQRSLWPEDALARAYARSAVCEMHSGFSAIRSNLPCNIRRRTGARELAPEVQREIARLEGIWTQLRSRFGAGGAYLFGAKRTVADAYFTPVATRFRTYGVALGPEAQRYVDTLLGDPVFRDWEGQAVEEPWSMLEWDSY